LAEGAVLKIVLTERSQDWLPATRGRIPDWREDMFTWPWSWWRDRRTDNFFTLLPYIKKQSGWLFPDCNNLSFLWSPHLAS